MEKRTYKLKTFVDHLDRALPVMALAMLLLVQSFITTGVVAGVELQGYTLPNGQQLTLADLCNRTLAGADEMGTDCSNCFSACTKAPASSIDTQPASYSSLVRFSVERDIAVKQSLAISWLARAPPHNL